MNPAIGAFVGVSKQTEMLLMTVLALWVNIFDMAIFEISSNLDQVWNVEIDKEIFNSNTEYVIRMLLSGVVLVRTFTLHLYIAFLIAVFWPVCFGTRPTLMLPWLVVSAIKNLGTGLLSIGIGGYTCMIYGLLRPACLRFLLSQLIDLSPSFYMWFVGLSLYCDLKKPKSVNRLQVKAIEDQELNMALRRRKVKSMIDEDILRQQFESRSFQKKFLGTSAVEVNEFINRCSYDNLKNKFSRSLDSLLDVLTVQTELLDIEDSEPLDIDSSSTLQQKTAKLLGISMDEIDSIKQNRQTRPDFPVYPVQPQKKIQTISLINSRYESPAKLLPETSLYSPPNVKPIRITKSELKSAKDFTKFESEFLQTVPEKEMQVHDLTQEESFESLIKMYQANDASFKPDVDAIVHMGSSKISLKNTPSTKEQAKENSIKNRDTGSQKPERGKLEDVQIESPNKYKFSNTMSDKSHYLLDERCFLFDKESMLMKKGSSKVVTGYAKRKRSIDQNPSEEKHRRLNPPTIKPISNTKFKDNIINKTRLDGKSENKNNKLIFKKTKEDVINKKLKQSEISQAIKKKMIANKIPPSDKTNISVLHRNVTSKIGNFNFDKNNIAVNDQKDNINKKNKNRLSHENKLHVIEENKSTLLKEDNTAEEKSKISVIAEVERINQNILITSSNTKKDLHKIEENVNNAPVVKKPETIKPRKPLHFMEFGIPTPFLSLKHSLKRVVPPLNEATSLQEKEITKEENKLLFCNTKIKTSEVLSEKILKFIEEKNNRLKANKTTVEDIFKDKSKPIKIVNNDNEFEFSAKIEENKINYPVKTSRNKQLEFHFKEKINKTKENKMEDLFKKKTLSEKKESKTSDKDKLGFPSYFSKKINRMITDACQIRKKSCKKINLFIKVPTNTNLKQRNKFSTIELFRKQSPPKTNLFDTSRKFSIGKLEIPPYKGDKYTERETNLNKNKPISPKIEIDLFNKQETKNEALPENIFTVQQHSSTSITLESLSKSSIYNNNKMINKSDEEQSISKTKINLSADIYNPNSLMNSFVIFDPNEISNKEILSTSPKIDVEVNNADGTFSVTKTKSSLSTNIDTTEAQLPASPRKKEVFDDVILVKKTESPYKIDLFKEKLNVRTAEQKSCIPVLQENKTCPRLAEQAMNKIIYLTKTKLNNMVDPVIKNTNCKRLSEHAINKIISLTNTGYSNSANKELRFNAINGKLNISMVHETIDRKIENYNDTSVMNQNYDSETSIKNKKPTFIEFSKAEKEIKEEISTEKKMLLGIKHSGTQINESKQKITNEKNILLGTKHSGLRINVTKSENLNNTIDDSKHASDSNIKALKINHSEKNNNLLLDEENTTAARSKPNSPKESKTKVNTKSSIPIIQKDSIHQKSTSITKIETNELEWMKPREEEKSNITSDKKCNKSHISSSLAVEFNSKSVSKSNIPLREEKETSEHNIMMISSTNKVNISNSNITETISMPVEKQNISIITEVKNCKESPHLVSSIKYESIKKYQSPVNDTILTTKEKKVNRTNIYSKEIIVNFEENKNIPKIKDDTHNEETVVKNKNNTALINNLKKPNSPYKTDKSQIKTNRSSSASKEEKECKKTPQKYIRPTASPNIESSNNSKLPRNENISSSEKQEQYYMETPQHRIQLFSSTKNECGIPLINNYREITDKLKELHINKEEIQSTPIKNKKNQIIPINKEVIQSTPIKKDEIQITPINKGVIQSSPIKKEKNQIILINQGVIQSSPTKKEEIQIIPINKGVIQSSPIKKEEIQISPINKEVIHSTTINKEEIQITAINKRVIQSSPIEKPKEIQITPINKGVIQSTPIVKEEIQSTPADTKVKVCERSVEEKKSITEKDLNLLLTKIGKINCDKSLETLSSNNSTNTIENEKKCNNIPQNIDNEYKTNIPVVKVEKECKGTSQHNIKLISSPTINFNENSNNFDESIKERKSNVMKIKHEGSLQISNELSASLVYVTAQNSIIPFKEEKVCKGTSQHDIKLISPIKRDNDDEKTLSKASDNLYVPLKEQKVCRGSPQHYIKLISTSKDEFIDNKNLYHKEALSNILKGYQSIPIMKEEKVCKGTSKHKIKLVSSYKKDSPNKINLFHTETESKSNKNENLTIIKEEKMCEGALQHSIKLISSTLNKTIFIVKDQVPQAKNKTPVTEEDYRKHGKSTTTSRPSTQTNLFVNVNTANGKQSVTVIQKQNDDKKSAQMSINPKVNLFVKNKMTNTDEDEIIKNYNYSEALRRMNLFSNKIQDFLESNREIQIEKSFNKSDTDLLTTKKECNVHSFGEIQSSEILSTLIHKVESSINQQKRDLIDEDQDEIHTPKCKYLSNQVHFGCQTSTLSKKILESNPNEVTKKLTRTTAARSYQDLNLQKLAFEMTCNKNSNSKLETKSSNNENLAKNEKKDSSIILNNRSSRYASYVSIHKERLEKAKSLESDLTKNGILHNCTFLEDGYTRLYDLFGVKHENFETKTRKKVESTFNF